MSTVRDFVISGNHQSVFTTNEFSDVTELHKYFLNQKRSEKDFIDKYEALNEILDCYSDLRAIAEEECNKTFNVQVYNRKNELPISLNSVCDYFSSMNDTDDPPTRLITKIAQEDFHIVYTLVNNMHKVLQRKRDLIPLDRVQQQDPQCIRWLIRQPGRNNIERAGSKQKLMAVVRYETSNTLENKVLKHFLKLCLMECDSYIRQYNNAKYQDNPKYTSVRSLRNLARYALELPEFKNISNLYNVPQPNYVLRNNAMYKTIWDYYLLLLRKTKIIEAVWANRHKVFADFARIVFLAVNHKKEGIQSNIRHNIWIRQFPDNKGNYFTSESWLYYDYDIHQQKSYKFTNSNGCLMYSTKNSMGMKHNTVPLYTAFVPDKTMLSPTIYAARLLIYDEGGLNIKKNIYSNLYYVKPSAGIVENIYSIIQEVCSNV